MESPYSALRHDSTAEVQSQIAAVLSAFPEPIVRQVADAGTVVWALKAGERYDAASPALKRMGIDVDAWVAPPAGLFVVEERTVYLRSYSPMTIAHEFGHAIDCALGGGVYLSGMNAEIRRAFGEARGYVTPYAAAALDEYFAESVRAYVGINDAASTWPRVSEDRLRRIDPAMHRIVAKLMGCAA